MFDTNHLFSNINLNEIIHEIRFDLRKFLFKVTISIFY